MTEPIGFLTFPGPDNLSIHIFDAVVDGREYRAYSMDRNPARLKDDLLIEGEIRISRDRWTYAGQQKWQRVVCEASPVHQELYQDVQKECVIQYLPPRTKLTLFVFDVPLDAADLRVYTTDEDARRFRSAQRTRFNQLNGEAEKLIGTVEIGSKDDALKHNIDDYDMLKSAIDAQGFFVQIVKQYDVKSAMGRGVLRKLHERGVEEKLGIRIVDLKIKELTPEDDDAPVAEDVRRLDEQLRKK